MSPVRTTCWINRQPIEALGLTVARLDGWLTDVAAPVPTSERLPGLTGGRLARRQASAPRVIELVGTFRPATLAARHALLNALSAALRGRLEVIFPDAPTYAVWAVAGPVVPESQTPFTRSELRVRVALHCADGARHALWPSQVYLSTTPRAVPIGSLAVGGEFLINGPLTGDLDIDGIAASGVRIGRHALRGITIASGGHLRLRADAPYALLYTDAADVTTSVFHWRDVDASTPWWKVSPLHGDAEGNLPVWLRLSTGTGWFRYRRMEAH